MGSEATYPSEGDDPLFTVGSPLDIDALFAEIDACNVDDLPGLDESAGRHIPPAPDPHSAGHITPDPQSAGDTSQSTITGLRQAVLYDPVGLAGPIVTVPENVALLWNAHPWFDRTETDPGFTVTGTAESPHSRTITRMAEAESPQSWNPLLGFNMQEINTVLNNSTATIKDILPVENPPQVPTLLVDNAGLSILELEPYSTGHTSSCPSTTAEARLLPSGGGALTEAPVASCKRKRLIYGSFNQMSTPPPELVSGLVQSDPSSTDIKPPTGSTDDEIIYFLRLQEISMAQGDQVNLSLGKQDQNCPKAVQSYVTTVEMMPDQKTHLGYWKEKQVKPLRQEDSYGTIGFWRGLKRTFQFHCNDGTKTNFFMHEYISTDVWGGDLYMKGLRFREVYEGAEVQVQGEGEPTSPEVKIKNKTAAAKENRMRGPENLVTKGESPAWQHFIKIYDKHPELEGSKVVYAVCCHCEVVLKAGTENGTKSLLTHCNRTCPVKNKKQQPSSSSSNSTGDTSCLSTAADTGSSSLDQDFNAGAGLLQCGGGGGCTLAEAPVQASCKRQKLVCGSSRQRSAPPEPELKELLADLVESDPSSTDIKPPTGSTDMEIISFLKRDKSLMPLHGKEVNLLLGKQDQMYPEDVQSYITTVKMMPDQNLQDLGYWKEKQVKLLRQGQSDGIVRSLCGGLKRTFQFHMDDGSETNWFMHEYVPMDRWGHDLFMKPLRFREVYEEVPEVKIKNKIAAGKKHRMRGPENMVVKGESKAWQHFIKIYDIDPEQEGSRVVYALCCHCEVVLKAGTKNGTSSLLQHCNSNCPAIKNKKQQPCSSSSQENHFGVSVGVGVL